MSAVMATLLPLTYNMRAAAAVGAAQRAADADRRARAAEVAQKTTLVTKVAAPH